MIELVAPAPINVAQFASVDKSLPPMNVAKAVEGLANKAPKVVPKSKLNVRPNELSLLT